jgi:hypothetical protein
MRGQVVLEGPGEELLCFEAIERRFVGEKSGRNSEGALGRRLRKGV